ncbi:MAG: hypothetical protein ABI680_06250, partial [Chthoniobacteraceae bacterium]
MKFPLVLAICRRLSMALALAFIADRTCPAQASSTPEVRRPDLERYRRQALTHEGDAARGAKLFADEQRLACTLCHSIDGTGSKAGPDLFAVGDAFARRDIIDAVLTPSKVIAPGYGTVTVEKKGGGIFQGILKQATNDRIQLMGADGKLVSIAKAEIQKQEGNAVSLMPEGLQAGLSIEEFTDLTEYLTTLRQPANTLVSEHGMPAEIAPLEKSIAVRPFFSEPLTLPKARVQTGLTAIHQVPGFPNVFLV